LPIEIDVPPRHAVLETLGAKRPGGPLRTARGLPKVAQAPVHWGIHLWGAEREKKKEGEEGKKRRRRAHHEGQVTWQP